MTPEKWQAAALTLGAAAFVAMAFSAPIEYALKRLDSPGLIRSIISVVFFVAFFSLAVYYGISYVENPLLVGLQCGLLGVASGQFGTLVTKRKRTRAA
ncbi:hypothetical protein [Cognatiluteimonas lumbrici]|uniref:hypothetical protein n=1 Tax=Cognatiluteimonas lumbrici TaxID=2559601 RepID=UPI00112E6880|nr:hypothetical protein [Luteimonas lumbrici]